MKVSPEKVYSGRKVVVWLLVGFTLFTAIMGFGSYGIAKVLTPILERHNAAAHK